MNRDVTTYLDSLNHPFRKEIEEVRKIILGANNALEENIKWNGPNYRVGVNDRVSIKVLPPKQIMIIFHRGAKVLEQPKEKILLKDYGLLEWKTNDRAIADLESKVATGEWEDAETMLASTATAAGNVSGSNGVIVADAVEADNIVENYKNYYTLYIRFMKDSVLSTDTAAIEELAQMCPLTEGDVVYQARALYAAVTGDNKVFTGICPPNGGTMSRKAATTDNGISAEQKSVVKSKVQEYSLSPNPNNGNMVVTQRIKDEKPVQALVLNGAGQQVQKAELKFEGSKVKLNLKNVVSGVYMLLLTDSKGETYTLKFTVL